MTSTQVQDNRIKCLKALRAAAETGRPKACGAYTRRSINGTIECCATPVFGTALGVTDSVEEWFEKDALAVAALSVQVARSLDTPETSIFGLSDNTGTWLNTLNVFKILWDLKAEFA